MLGGSFADRSGKRGGKSVLDSKPRNANEARGDESVTRVWIRSTGSLTDSDRLSWSSTQFDEHERTGWGAGSNLLRLLCMHIVI